MARPFFFIDSFDFSSSTVDLNEDTSRHVIQVLRMKTGEELILTDGKGVVLTGAITDEHKKRCSVRVLGIRQEPAPVPNITIAISLIKNAARFEWFLEKATEIGIREIIPLLCERTEKQKFRLERMRGIVISAMLQSQQCWLPVLGEPVGFKKVVSAAQQQQKFIAHCIDGEKHDLTGAARSLRESGIILIGPEGDFSKEEIGFSIQHQFVAVALGETRLRTETAGLVAATLLKMAG